MNAHPEGQFAAEWRWGEDQSLQTAIKAGIDYNSAIIFHYQPLLFLHNVDIQSIIFLID